MVPTTRWAATRSTQRQASPIQGMLVWARKNQTEFYRLFAKMIPRTEELSDNTHEDFIAELIIEEEEQAKVIEGEATNVVDVTNEAVK